MDDSEKFLEKVSTWKSKQNDNNYFIVFAVKRH